MRYLIFLSYRNLIAHYSYTFWDNTKATSIHIWQSAWILIRQRSRQKISPLLKTCETIYHSSKKLTGFPANAVNYGRMYLTATHHSTQASLQKNEHYSSPSHRTSNKGSLRPFFIHISPRPYFSYTKGAQKKTKCRRCQGDRWKNPSMFIFPLPASSFSLSFTFEIIRASHKVSGGTQATDRFKLDFITTTSRKHFHSGALTARA